MDVISHSLTYLDQCKGDIDKFKDTIPYLLVPDAIRFWTKNREFSHFEETRFGDVSYMVFPENLKELSEEKINELKENGKAYLSDDIQKAAVGEETHIEKFIETNKELPEKMFNGILNHLIQDKTYDIWVREIFDCSNKYKDIYFDKNNNLLDGKELRSEIRNYEIENNKYLVNMIDDKYGIKINQEWIDENIKKPLQEKYDEKMFKNTEKFLLLDERINEKNKDINNKEILEILNKNIERNTEYILNTKDLVNNFNWPSEEIERTR